MLSCSKGSRGLFVPELAQAAQWAIEQGYLKARADGSFKPDKGVAKWRVIRGYRAVTEP